MRYLRSVLLSLVATSMFAASPGVSVIDRQMIERYHFSSVARAIETVAGMDVMRTYFKQNVVTARGILQEHYANKIVMMIDGIPAWNAVTGEPIVDRISIEDVERIEITKGPASVEFGTNAYVAAINIVLRRDTSGAVAAHLRAGSESSSALGAHATMDAGRTQIFASANVRGDDGQPRSILDEKNQRDAFREYQKGSDATLQLRGRHQSLLVNFASETESSLGNTPDIGGGLGKDHRSRGLLAAWEVTIPVTSFDLRYRASYDQSSRNFARTGDGKIRSNVAGRRLANLLQAGIKVRPGLRVDGGIEQESRHSVEYTNYDVASGRVLEDNGMRGHSISDWSAFAHATVEHEALTVNGGTRYTRSEVGGSNLSSNGSLDYRLDSSNRISFQAGQSFRVPSFFELYFHTSTNTVFGNTALKPETSTSYEFVYAHSSGNVEVQATLYHAIYNNKIFRTRRLPDDPVDRSLMYVNGNRFNANGLELEARKTLGTASAFATYSFVDGSSGDAAPGSSHYNFRYVPQHSAAGGVSKTAGAWSAAAVATWLSPTHGPKASVPSRGSIDLDLGYTMKLRGVTVRHSLIASNATDAEQQIPEYVRRNINSVPSGVGRRVMYQLEMRR